MQPIRHIVHMYVVCMYACMHAGMYIYQTYTESYMYRTFDKYFIKRPLKYLFVYLIINNLI